MITFPERAKVGKIVAKEYFYKNIDAATKNLFQSEIARIIWEYKLAPNTINLPVKKWAEIEVFRIVLKNGEIPEKVLRTIDSVIPYPILFIIEKGSVKKKPPFATKSKVKKMRMLLRWILTFTRSGMMRSSRTLELMDLI